MLAIIAVVAVVRFSVAVTVAGVIVVGVAVVAIVVVSWRCACFLVVVVCVSFCNGLCGYCGCVCCRLRS